MDNDFHQYTVNSTDNDTLTNEENTRLAAGFLLAYTLLGLGSFVWAFWSQRSQLKKFKGCTSSRAIWNNSLQGLENVHGGLISVLVVDIINAATAIFLAVQFVVFNDFFVSTSRFVFSIWYLLRYVGLVMHLLVALLCLHFLCHQHYGAQMRVLYIGVVVLNTVVVSLYMFLPVITTFGMVALLFALALVIMVKCAALPFPRSAKALKNQVVSTSMVTFCIIYLPSFVAQCIYFGIPGHSTALMFLNVLFGTNIHLFLDGLLCFFILRFPGGEQQQ